MSGSREIERKFLVKKLPSGWRSHPHRKIQQGYFQLQRKDIEIRLRRADSEYFLTIKSGQGQTRQEEEIELTKDRFKRLWPLTAEARVVKTRYQIPFEGKTIEVDVYTGSHAGLITAEIEFSSSREARSFQFPQWFGPEVTGKLPYTNSFLARHGRQSKTASPLLLARRKLH